MSAVTEVHVERETLTLDVNIPGHEARTTTALFTRSKKQLIAREGGRCWISGATAEQSGHPLEAHHFPVERSMANLIDWQRFATDCKAGQWGPHARSFDWEGFFEGATHERVVVPAFAGDAHEPAHDSYTVTMLKPRDPYLFVDDMTVNGMLLSKQHHTGKNDGIHDVPFPLWVAKRYAIEGYKYSSTLTVHHFEGDGHE
jgi:hypothetical protein